MKFYKSQCLFVIRFDDGEEIISSLLSFCKKQDIRTAYFSGIGACRNLIISYFDKRSKSYKDRKIKENYEITSLVGFITIASKKPHAHAHIAIANNKNKVFGGHLKQAVTSPTCEMFLVPMEKIIERKKYKDTNLMLMG